MKRTLLTIFIAIISVPALAQSHSGNGNSGQSAYAGQQARAIKSLSPGDIKELKRGGGWGLAKAAELNGVPGPVHLLELKDKVGLTSGQVTRLESLFGEMQTKAIEAGARLIEAEARLEAAFRARTIDDAALRKLLEEIEGIRSHLRFIHLSAHLATPAVLSEDQIDRYNSLRGYGRDDPCGTVPEGHDPVMWRKHNGCEH